MDLLQSFRAARRCSVPLIVVRTADPAGTMNRLLAESGDLSPAILWDIVNGAQMLNEAGDIALNAMLRKAGMEPSSTTNPTEFCSAAKYLDDGTNEDRPSAVVFMANLHRFADDIGLVQALWNLRDVFKVNGRTIVGLVPSITLPAELSQDVLVLDEALPDDKILAGIAREIFLSAQMPEPEQPALERIIDATLGLAAFPAEQAMAMCMTRKGMNIDDLWARKRGLIAQTEGLSVVSDPTTFDDIGGVQNAKTFLLRVMNSSEPPRCIVFIDEGEKAFAGSSVGGGDSSGVSQNFLGTLLTTMQEEKYRGVILLGFPGSAKSMLAKSMGATAGVPTIQFDLAGMKSSLVGSSEANLRRALATVKAVSQGRAYFCMTCNSIASLPPELKRRFRDAIFFFNTPEREEKDVIWALYLRKYEGKIADVTLPDDTHWTGSEIATCVDNAARFGISLVESATYIVPAFDSMGQAAAARLREEASGRYISASYPGPYRNETSQPAAGLAASSGRRMAFEE